MSTPQVQRYTHQNLSLAYNILNPTCTKTAIIHTCFRGRISTTQTFSAGSLSDHKIILLALLGNGESSSPSNDSSFPQKIDYTDHVALTHTFLTQELKLQNVDVMLGFSMGGQMTYHFIATHPSFVENAVIICSSAVTSPHNFQFLEGPRAALESARTEEAGIRAFGKAYSAWLTSAEWFDEEGWRELGFESQKAWDEVATWKGYEGWTGKDLLVMLGMWQRGDVSRCGEKGATLEEVLTAIQSRVLLMPCETDQYFRPYVNFREAKSLKNGRVEVVPTTWGHIGGGGACKKDTEFMDKTIKEFLRG